MVMDFDQTKELETLKQNNKIALIDIQAKDRKIEHDEKMIRLEKLFEIAKLGGKVDYE